MTLHDDLDAELDEFEKDVEAEPPAPARTPRGAAPKRTRKRRIKRATVITHRWLSLIAGLVLVLITTTGALVVYTPEWTVWTNQDTFAVQDGAARIAPAAAVGIVDQAHPDFDAGTVNVYHGLYEVLSADTMAHPGFYGVDPATGGITGFADPDHGFMGLMNQVHECFFSCDSYPAYASWLNAAVPGPDWGWLADLTWGGLVLGLMGLGLIFLGLSGIWLWWPTFKKWRHGFRVRWRKGRYARDYDLHQVIGMAAVPFLLIWGLTGATFEFTWVTSSWYAVTGGQTPSEDALTSTAPEKGTGTDIGLTSAAAAAQTVAGPKATLVYASSPEPDDPEGTYYLYYAKGFDPWKYGAYPGSYGVQVDRYDATRTMAHDYGTATTLSNRILDVWGAPTLHYGSSVNGWWRIAWFLFGMTPLVLAITGISTWLYRRGVQKRRAEAIKMRATADA